MLRRNPERVTQRLSSSTYSLTTPGGKRVLPWVLVGVAMLMILGAGAYVLKASSPVAQAQEEVARLQQENLGLQQQIKLGELRLQQEIVTREELVHQMDAQSQKLRQAEQDLQFFRGQKDKPARDKLPQKQ